MSQEPKNYKIVQENVFFIYFQGTTFNMPEMFLFNMQTTKSHPYAHLDL